MKDCVVSPVLQIHIIFMVSHQLHVFIYLSLGLFAQCSEREGLASLRLTFLCQARSTVGAGSKDLEIGSGVFSEKHNRGYKPLLYKAKEEGKLAEGGLLLGEAERKAKKSSLFFQAIRAESFP